MYNLTRQEASEILGVSIRSLDRYIKAWKIRTQKQNSWIVYVNDEDIRILSWVDKKTPEIIINKSSYKKENILDNEDESSYQIAKKSDYDKLTSTFEKVYTDLRTELIKKDEIIQKLSLELWKNEEKVNNSVSLLEFRETKLLLEESKESIWKQFENVRQEKEKLEKNLKEEKFEKKVLIWFVVILLLISGYFWFINM